MSYSHVKQPHFIDRPVKLQDRIDRHLKSESAASGPTSASPDFQSVSSQDESSFGSQGETAEVQLDDVDEVFVELGILEKMPTAPASLRDWLTLIQSGCKRFAANVEHDRFSADHVFFRLLLIYLNKALQDLVHLGDSGSFLVI